MTLVDANILIYAYNPQATQHEAAKRWLESAFSGTAPVRLAWTSVVAFVRIMTHPQVFQRPLSIEEAVAVVDSWLAAPAVDVLPTGDRHWAILRDTLAKGQARAALASDAHLAALAIEYGAVLATTDRDFARFDGLRTINPIEA